MLRHGACTDFFLRTPQACTISRHRDRSVGQRGASLTPSGLSQFTVLWRCKGNKQVEAVMDGATMQLRQQLQQV